MSVAVDPLRRDAAGQLAPDGTPSRRAGSLPWWPFAAIVGVGAVLRLVGIGRLPLDFDESFTATAGRGLYEGSHVQRAYADLHALQGHIVAGWEMPAYSYGQVMLGGQPSDSFT